MEQVLYEKGYVTQNLALPNTPHPIYLQKWHFCVYFCSDFWFCGEKIIQIITDYTNYSFYVTKNAQPIEPTRLRSVVAYQMCSQASLQHP